MQIVKCIPIVGHDFVHFKKMSPPGGWIIAVALSLPVLAIASDLFISVLKVIVDLQGQLRFWLSARTLSECLSNH